MGEFVTESSRRRHIEQALKSVQESKGLQETVTVPLRGGILVPVIELPLDVPVLNPHSFRIAPQLLDDSRGDSVRSDPFTETSQAVIADLVRQVHRNVEQLKENLSDEGQQSPGVVTREGVLINANTRCVLLRDLAREGRLTKKTVRVAVLPSDVTDAELLETEMLLQQQVELKDEYRLISALMMVKRLHDIGMSDDEIGKRQRLRKARGRSAGQQVAERRSILMLMERARRLVDPALPLTAFDSDEDKYENWRDLLNAVETLDREGGDEAGNDHIRRWMIAYFTGLDSVHRLRPMHATASAGSDWIAELLLPDVEQHADVAEAVAAFRVEHPEDDERNLDDGDDDLGIGLLGDPIPDSGSSTDASAVLQVVLAVRETPPGEPVVLPSGKHVPASEVRDRLRSGVERSLGTLKRAGEAGDRLLRPGSEINKAASALADTLSAIESVKSDPDFVEQLGDVEVALQQLETTLAKVKTAITSIDRGV